MGVLPRGGWFIPTDGIALEFYVGEMPIFYQDEYLQRDLGESNLHTVLDHIICMGLKSHCGHLPGYQAFANLNCYYCLPGIRDPHGVLYFSPDSMVVRPHQVLPENVESYSMLRDGPAPEVVVEILSSRTALEYGLDSKAAFYGNLGVREYILVDKPCDFLLQRLLLKRLRSDRTWEDCLDADGGVTSNLGFRLLFEEDDQLRVVNAETGHRYVRPEEAEQQFLARQFAEKAFHNAEVARIQALDQIRELQEEIKRLREEKAQRN